MNYLKQFVFAFVLILIMVVAIKLQININEQNEKKQELIAQREELKYQNEKMQNELDTPMDDDYIAKVAAEQGYKYPNAQYFYNDLPD